jgi:hypothetical protein
MNSHDYDDALKNIEIDKTFNINNHCDKNYEINITDEDFKRYMLITSKCEELEWDAKKIYDEGLFNVCDPSTQFIFIKSCKDLYKMAMLLKRNNVINMLENWIKLYSFGSNYLWDMKIDAYTTMDIKTNILYKNISSGGLLSIYADVGNKEQRDAMLIHSKRILYYSKHGFPSWDPKHIDFDSKKYWKGSHWCIINFLMAIGFSKSGQTSISEKIKKYTITKFDTNGFFEYFIPYSGVGCGSINCPMTASIYLLF